MNNKKKFKNPRSRKNPFFVSQNSLKKIITGNA